MNDPTAIGIVEHIKSLKFLPAQLIDAVVGFSGTANPQFFRDRVHQACLDWRGDLERYLLEQLDAAEVVLDVPTERMRLIVPSESAMSKLNGQGLPFYFRSQLALLPTELERTAPKFAQFISNIERNDGQQTARAHLERAMAVTVWVLLRLSIDDSLHKSRDMIAQVSDTGVDLIWRGRPRVSCHQDTRSFGFIIAAGAHGELVPKRKITGPFSTAKH